MTASSRNPSRDPDLYGSDDTKRQVLRMGTWAVVGLGADPAKAAYGVSGFLQSQGKRIVPVHPRDTEVHGERVVRSLADAVTAAGEIDVVDVFRRSSAAGQSVDEAIAIGAQAVWLQLGVFDEDAARRARDAGLLVVMDTCPKIEWPRLGPRGS